MIRYEVIFRVLMNVIGRVRTNSLKVLVLYYSGSWESHQKGPKALLVFPANFWGWGASGTNICPLASPSPSASPGILFDSYQGPSAVSANSIKKAVSVHVRFHS